TNIRQYLAPEFQHLTTAEFRDELIKRIWQVPTLEEARVNEYQLTDKDKAAIQQLVKQRYANWDWVYGKSPEFTVKKRQHFDAGTIDARYQVEAGKIVAAHLYGDFFGTGDVNEVAQALVGLDYEPAAIRNVLRQFDLQRYFLGIPDEQVISLLSQQQ
ncbi:MAG: lipoate--protein ligase, partial [[Lactobacillus] timonensis]|nr:lipoate--protein ligase [[Lactobacillus] timonensis]